MLKHSLQLPLVLFYIRLCESQLDKYTTKKHEKNPTRRPCSTGKSPLFSYRRLRRDRKRSVTWNKRPKRHVDSSPGGLWLRRVIGMLILGRVSLSRLFIWSRKIQPQQKHTRIFTKNGANETPFEKPCRQNLSSPPAYPTHPTPQNHASVRLQYWGTSFLWQTPKRS